MCFLKIKAHRLRCAWSFEHNSKQALALISSSQSTNREIWSGTMMNCKSLIRMANRGSWLQIGSLLETCELQQYLYLAYNQRSRTVVYRLVNANANGNILVYIFTKLWQIINDINKTFTKSSMTDRLVLSLNVYHQQHFVYQSGQQSCVAPLL